MTPEQLHILRHSLGLDDNGHGNCYRSYYCANPGESLLVELEKMGLMKFDGERWGYHYYSVTATGREAALKDVVYPKLTKAQRRYRAWLRNASGSFTFGEWLKTPLAKEVA